MALETIMRNGDNARRAGKRVLIVEDNELNMKLFNDLLEAHGYTTLQTRDGVEALQMVRQHAYDLVLTDLRLDDVDGLSIVSEVCRLYPDTVSIIGCDAAKGEGRVRQQEGGTQGRLRGKNSRVRTSRNPRRVSDSYVRSCSGHPFPPLR